jgi:hypothetical protein
MFEFIGLIIVTAFLGGLSCVAGAIFGLIGWLIFWGRHRPKLLILATMAVPPASLLYVAICAVVFTLFVPNQPDEFFGDFSEPLPNGYILTGLAKMPDYAYFESTPPMAHQPPLIGGVKSLEQDGELIYGSYGHLYSEDVPAIDVDHGYFVFDTRTGAVRNLKTISELNQAAGHSVKLELSENFRSRNHIASACVNPRLQSTLVRLPQLLCSASSCLREDV